MLSGCFAGTTHERVVTNGGLVVAGLVMATAPQWHGCTDGDMDARISCDIEAHIVSITGVVLVLAGAAFAVAALSADDHRDEPKLAAASLPSEELRALTKRAAAAGGAGQCSEVRDIASQVAALDADYRTHGFVQNMSISLCLR